MSPSMVLRQNRSRSYYVKFWKSREQDRAQFAGNKDDDIPYEADKEGVSLVPQVVFGLLFCWAVKEN
jgi:hypothetical protein